MSAILFKTKIKHKKIKSRDSTKSKLLYEKTNNKIKTYQNLKPLVWLIKREKKSGKNNISKNRQKAIYRETLKYSINI